MHSATIATRGNHSPVHQLPAGRRQRNAGRYDRNLHKRFWRSDRWRSQAGTRSGLGYTTAYPSSGDIAFEVFPGSPSVTNGNTIVFKGNYTAEGAARTGVYYRELAAEPWGGTSQSVLIANSAHTLIPGTTVMFGSTAPPNAADNKAVFAGFDNEQAPTLGGIYLAPLQYQPPLTTVVAIGDRVPGQPGAARFNAFGESIAFDGRFVGFWGAWGEDSRTVKLYCKEEGNKDRIAYCNQALTARLRKNLGRPSSICDDETDPRFGKSCYTTRQVPEYQGIFVHDTVNGKTSLIAQSDSEFEDFLFWNYSGRVPCSSHGHGAEGGEDDGESIRWRSSAFVAVSTGIGAKLNTAFKARSGRLRNGIYENQIDGIYLRTGSDQNSIVTVVDTTMNGQVLDPEAPPDSKITELGLEREGLRGRWLTINASMEVEGGEEEDGMAGVYITQIE